jgi:dethiobiotin synthetase
MTASYFVTGTDTGVGKTHVASELLTRARARGMTTAVLKPAETGCAADARGDLVPADGLRLRAAAGATDLPIDRIVPHRYATPVAPAVAARLEGRPFSLERTLAAARDLAGADLFLIEGAGGLLVPFSDDLLAADVAAALAAPLLIVARARLGTINHTLLTVFEARRRGLSVAAVILNPLPADITTNATNVADPSIPLNAGEIERIGQVRVLVMPDAIDALLQMTEKIAHD